MPTTGEDPCHEEEWLIQDPHGDDEGKTAVRLLELRPGETTPNHAVCWDCRQKTGELVSIPWFAHGGAEGQRCVRCAIAAGEREKKQAHH